MNYGYSVKYYIYRQEIGNPANLQKIDKEVRRSQPTFARNGRMYYEEANSYSGSYCCYIVDTDKFTMKEPETYNIYDENDRQYVLRETYLYNKLFHCSFISYLLFII